MKIKRQDGKVFTFNLNNIARGAWVVELLSVDDEQGYPLSYGDPIGSEREARAYIRRTIDRWYRDDRHGWCQR